MEGMSEENFQQVCQFLIESGLSVRGIVFPQPSAPVPLISNDLASFLYSNLVGGKNTPEQSLIESQNTEFDRAERDAIEKEKQTVKQQFDAEERRIHKLALEESKAELLRQRIRQRADQIPPEPANGVTIAICMPDSKRVTRKFGVDDSAENVFAFVANNDQMFDEKANPFRFDLAQGRPGLPNLDRKRTLAQQGVCGRILLRVVLDTDE
jgi:hypothetical protein